MHLHMLAYSQKGKEGFSFLIKRQMEPILVSGVLTHSKSRKMISCRKCRYLFDLYFECKRNIKVSVIGKARKNLL